MRLEICFSHKTSQIYRKCQMHITFDCKQMLCSSQYLLSLQIWIIMMQMFRVRVSQISRNLLFLLSRQKWVNYIERCSFGILENKSKHHCELEFCNIFACIWSTVKTVIFAKDVNLSKLVRMLKICTKSCCKYGENVYQTITFTWLLRIITYPANMCICMPTLYPTAQK